MNSSQNKDMVYDILNNYPAIMASPVSFSIQRLLFLGILLFVIGLLGIVLNRNNVLILLMSIEIMLLGPSLCLMAFGVFFAMPQGFVYALLILAVAAAESAIGLSILVVYYRLKDDMLLGSANMLKG